MHVNKIEADWSTKWNKTADKILNKWKQIKRNSCRMEWKVQSNVDQNPAGWPAWPKAHIVSGSNGSNSFAIVFIRVDQTKCDSNFYDKIEIF